MAGRSRGLRIIVGLARAAIYLIVCVLVLIGLGYAALETGWGKNQLRQLIVRQANLYLTATVDIGRLGGSLLRGISLSDVRLSRDGRTLVAIDDVSLDYSIRELFSEGVVVRRIRLTRPRISAGRQPDGRWDLAALVRREARAREQTGPRRPITLQSIEVIDGTVDLRDPYRFGPAWVPTHFEALNLAVSFSYEPVAWRLKFDNASWIGSAPDLTVNRLTGAISSGRDGLTFSDLTVQTPTSAYAFAGRVIRNVTPSVLDLHVKAERFSFQEWSGVIREIRSINVDAAFEATLKGPLAALDTNITLQSNGGDVRAALVLNTTRPGWSGSGSAGLTHFDVARWFSLPDRPSDVTGQVQFNLTRFAPRFPLGSYVFDGTRTAFMGYVADALRARGTITEREVLIASAVGRAYGADLTVTNGSIAIDRPFAYHFMGQANDVDLRGLPESIPVPHVESRLAFDYEVTGRFAMPFITGRALFGPSEFLGATIGAGTVGSIDTSTTPIEYSGEGDIDQIDLNRFGAGLGFAWMQDPRYKGTVSGHFRVAGAGGDSPTMTLNGGGRLTEANLFGGTLSDADVSLQVADGSLSGTYGGRLSSVNPALALNDPRFDASLTGTGRGRVSVRELLVRSPLLGDYDIDATLELDKSVARGIQLDSARVSATLKDSALNLTEVRANGPLIEATGSGLVALDGVRSSEFTYDIARGDLSLARDTLGRDIAGAIVTKGRLTGPTDAMRVQGEATVTRLEVAGVKALTTTATYDATIPSTGTAERTVRTEGRASFVELFGQELLEAAGTVTLTGDRLNVDLKLQQREGVAGALAGSMVLHSEQRTLDLLGLTIAIQNSQWQLAGSTATPTIAWDDDGITLPALLFTNTADAQQRIAVSGTWREDGRGALRVVATHVFLETFAGLVEQPARYGGIIDVDATIRGTRDRPTITSELTITSGRIRRVSYEKLAGRIDYTDGLLDLNIRLDQAPGIYLIASGTVPVAVFDRNAPEKPMNVSISSSSVDLGLIEGITDQIREVAGQLIVDLRIVGTNRDPHFTGAIELADAAFVATATGAQFKNGQVVLLLAADRVIVQQFHVEDRNGAPLDMTGSLGTHELTVGDLEIDAVARRFTLLSNEFGTMETDANLSFRGEFESPRITGDITVVGGVLNVNEILDRTLLKPYATVAQTTEQIDAVAALNPWQRLGMDVNLHIPNTLRMTGDDVQIAAGTPLGLGSFNLRVLGDLNLYKDPNQPLYVNGSLDSVTGSYSFQGRRFDVNPTSSINFRGDRVPEVFITVEREISGVQARVTIAGPLDQPEIRLASTPMIAESDILSLIVFNTTTNELSAEQQRDLAVRAGTLAAGFLATPLLTALERSLGLDIVQIEAAGDPGTARVTIGDEIAPGLVARFSRQFGRDEYDEATLEYSISRILRIRATFSDAGALAVRSRFRRIERAGIDLIVFLSF
jgi:autotransporter translocation and assembly factor TamB